MTRNYIILAHKNPIQLSRLINRLDDDHSNFYIHIDKSTDIREFKINIQKKQNIYFIEKIN